MKVMKLWLLFLSFFITSLEPLFAALPKDRLTKAYGRFDRGSLEYAQRIPNEGIGFLKILRHRHRAYGTDELIELIKDLGRLNETLWPKKERLQIGDLSYKKGGLAKGHKSHQNGTDVDIVYLRNSPEEQKPNGPMHWQEYFVHGKKISKNFDVLRNWQLIKNILIKPEVALVLVDASIKKIFCDRFSSKESHQMLFDKLAVAPYHKSHFHVRVRCPKNSPNCKNSNLKRKRPCF